MKQANQSFRCSGWYLERMPGENSLAFAEKEVLSQVTGPRFVAGLADLWPSTDLAMQLVQRLKADYSYFECQTRTFLKSAATNQENSVVGSLRLLQCCEIKKPVAEVKMWLLGFQASCSERNKEEIVACPVGLYWFAMQTWTQETRRVLLAALENQVTLGPIESEESCGTKGSVMIQPGQDLGSEVRKLWADFGIALAAALGSLEPCYFVGEKLTGSVVPGWPLDFGLG